MTIRHHIEQELKKIFSTLDLPQELAIVTPSDRPDLSDYQCNAALSAARTLKKNPREIAQNIVAQFSLPSITLQIDGPGFINFKLDDQLVAKEANTLSQDPRLGCPLIENAPLTVIDYGGPNVAKPLHVGHLRSSIIGESLKRLFRFMGHETLGDIHMGDWGTQMGMLLVAIQQEHPDWPYFHEPFVQKDEPSPITLEDLQRLYPLISAQCKEDPETAEQCRLATAALQKGRPGYRTLWQHFVDISIQDMQQHLDKLDVHFDLWYGESRYQDRLDALITDLKTKKILQQSEGAWIIPVAQDDEMPPVLVQKSDGAVLYASTDLATIDERVNDLGAKIILYVVDARQSLHFEQVFRAAHKIGWHAQMEHLGFGTMNGPDGKPFKTRAGGVMQLGELIETLTHEAHQRVQEAGLASELSPQELEDVAQCVGIAALKFADLQHDRVQNYQFDLEKFMRFEGKTGPYLLYATVRIKSILRRAAEQGLQAGPVSTLQLEERGLLVHLMNLPLFLERAYERRQPNVLCDYAFTTAQLFSRFYQACHVLGETDQVKQASRLTICQLTLRSLELVLDLLSIATPERM